jgi:hypothetical protein
MPPKAFVHVQYHPTQHPDQLLPVIQHQLEGIQHAYRDSLHNHPLVTKMLTGGTLAASGDAIAQRQSRRKGAAENDAEEEPYDRRRALSFFSFDMAYRALQHHLFPILVANCHGQFLSRLLSILPSAAVAVTTTTTGGIVLPTEYLAAMEQTLASQLGIVPFLYYPVFFTLTGSLQGLTYRESWTRAADNFPKLMKRNLLFWIPVQFVQFGFVPEDLQIPFLSMAGLCWTFILSMAAGSARSYSSPPHPPIVIASDPSAGAAGTKLLTTSSAAITMEDEPVTVVLSTKDQQAPAVVA